MGRYLVTGGAGFIGSHLVRALVMRGESVRVLDNLSTGFRKNLDEVMDRIEFVQGDVRDYEKVCAALSDVDVVYHEAALPSVVRSVQNPRDSNDSNITGTLNILTGMRDNGVRRFIMASSSSVYGKNPALPKVETMATAPLSPYAVTKVTCELYARVFSELYGLETICLRYFNVFGPRQDPTTQYAGVVAKFMTCALRGQPYPVYGDGEQSRDFTFVEDVVQANLLGAAAKIEGHIVANIACGERTTLNQIITVLNDLTQQNLPTIYGPARAGDVRHSLASIETARTILGYEPHTDFRTGLNRTLEWYRSETNG